MLNTPGSFTREYLQSLKFKEIQKLSVQYNVNKRWAKKQELIENLLGLKAKYKTENDNKQEDEKEWKDGCTIFNDLNLNSSIEINRRLTYNISGKINADALGSHAASEHQECKLLCGHTNGRETYDIPPKKIDLSVEPLTESKGAFDIFSKENLVHEVNSRATFDIPQNEKKLLGDCKINIMNITYNADNLVSENLTNSDKKITYNDNPGQNKKLNVIKFDLNQKEKQLKGDNKTKRQDKMLTIPCAKVSGRTKKNEILRNDNSSIRMSKKSINIKKLSKLPVRKNELVKSPIFSSVQKSLNKQSIIKSLCESQTGTDLQSEGSIEIHGTIKSDIKEKTKRIQNKKVLKPADENLKKKLDYVKVDFGTQTPSFMNLSVMPLKKKSLLKLSNERNICGKFNSSTVQTPGDKPITAIKALTATKMPDFNKIHKKQFEQMDSLHDYIRKKEERIKKLFGAPQPGQQLQVQMKLAPLFQFQSETVDKKSRGKENLKNLATSLKRKEHNSKNAQKEAVKSRLPPLKLQNDLTNKNRSIIQGVRTNKRFELQMKLRNM